MSFLTRLSLSKIPIVLMLAVLIVGGGLYSATQLKSELLPDIAFPLVSVVAVYPGASPTDVRRDVAEPIEKAMAGTANLKTITSQSNDSLAFVTAEYEYGTDMEKTQQTLQDLINKINFPSQVQKPTVGRFSLGDVPVLAYSLNIQDGSNADALYNLKLQVQQNLVPKLQAIPGVNNVVLSGGGDRSVVITFDPAKLAAAGLTASAVQGVLQANNLSFPTGDITTNNQSIPVRVTHQFASVDDLKSIVVGYKMPAGATGAGSAGAAGAMPGAAGATGTTGAMPGATGAITGTTGTQPGGAPGPAAAPQAVTLGDVSTVALQNAAGDSINRTDGKASLGVVIYKTQNANTVQVADAVNAQFDDLAKSIPDAEPVKQFDSSVFIKDSLNGLIREGVLGAILAIIVILVFLFSVRSTLVAGLSIPMSILIALIMLNVFNISLNIMSLAGLAVAVGRVVDDSIVVLENIYRHHFRLREPIAEAAFNGTKEVATAITSSTLTTVSVFLPLGFIAGLVSQFFQSFAIAVSVALLASLVVALTMVPVLASLFIATNLATYKGERQQKDTWLQRLYTPTISLALRNGWTKAGVLLLAVLLFAGSRVPVLTGGIGFSFLSVGSDKVISASVQMKAGTDLATTDATARAAEQQISADPAVDHYQTTIGANTGGASTGYSSLGSASIIQWSLTLKPDADLDKEAAWLRGIIKPLQVAGKVDDFSVTTGTGVGPSSTNYSVVLSGANYNDVKQTADALTAKLKAIPDLVNVTSDAQAAKPEIRVMVDPTKALQHGSTPIQIATQVRTLLTQSKITSITIGGQDYDVLAAYDPSVLNSLDKIKALLVGAANPVPLEQVATVEMVDGPVSITRVNQEQAITVQGTITSKSTTGVQTAARQAIQDLGVDAKTGQNAAGTKVTEAGVTQQQTQAFSQLGFAIVVSIVLVYIIMVTTFGSLVTPFVILFSLPLAAIGSLLALWVTGQPLGVSAMIGVLMLVGIVVTNAIVLLDLVEQLRNKGMATDAALIEGGRTRVRPIMMTAIATIIALIPLAAGGESGSLIASELGIVVIGGLFSSTMLTLIVVPVIYSLFDGLERQVSRQAPEGVARPVPAPGAPPLMASTPEA